MTKRIAFGRIFQETCAGSPLQTTREDFERMHYLAGDELTRACAIHRSEVSGFVRNLELSGFITTVNAENARALIGKGQRIEPVPLFSALATPGGQVTEDTFAWLRDELRDRLQDAGELDGVFLSLHGSMQVEGMAGSPEAELLRVVREIVGDRIPVAITLDLHAHVTEDLVAQANIVAPYLTNPHRDMFRTGRLGGKMLIDTVCRRIHPTSAWRKLPVAIGGGDTLDFAKPMKPVFSRLHKVRRSGEALYASLCMVHPFTHAEDIGWVVHVTTDNDQAKAEALADEISDVAFAAAKVPIRKFLTPTEALDAAEAATLARKTGVVSIVDTADVTTAGAPGGNTWLLKELVDNPRELVVFLCVHDPDAVGKLYGSSVGAEVSAVVKGSPGMVDNPEVLVRGSVIKSATTRASGRAVSVNVGNIRLILTEKPPVTIFPRLFREVGLNPWHADVVVHKTFFHYRWFFGVYNRKNIPMVTPGATNFANLKAIPRKVDLIPYAKIEDWRAADKLLRGDSSSSKRTTA